MGIGQSSSDPKVGSAPRPAYYGGRGADAYLRRGRGGAWKIVVASLGAVAVLLAVGYVGYVLGRNSVDDTGVTASATTTVDPLTATTAAPATTVAPTATSRPETYIVKAGDSLAKIAKRYNTTIAALVELNGIANPDRLIEGTRLKIPPPTETATTPAPAAPPASLPAPPST